MTKKEFQLFDITYLEEETQYQKLNELLQTTISEMLCLGKIFEPIHFSYNIKLPEKIEIQTAKKTEQQIMEEILKIYLRENISPEYQEFIPNIMIWIQKKENFSTSSFRTLYRKKSILKIPFTKEEENWLFLFYLNQMVGLNMFLWMKLNLIPKEVLKKQMYSYFDDQFYPEKNIQNEMDVLKYINKYLYGWYDKEKKLHKSLKEWKEQYYIYPIDFLLEKRIGCCMDYAKVRSYFLSRLKIPHKNILLRYIDNNKIKYHAQTFFQKNGIWYEMADTYIKPIGNINEIYQVNFGDSVVDRLEFDESLENVSIKEILDNWKSFKREKVLESTE